MNTNESTNRSPVPGDRFELIHALILQYRRDRSLLIEALFAIQDLVEYLPDPVVGMLAEGFQIPRAEILAIATSIPGIFLRPRGKFLIQCCVGLSCVICREKSLLEPIRRHLKVCEGEGTKDGKFFLKAVYCLGACHQGPAIMVNDRIFSNQDETQVIELLQRIGLEGLEREPS